MLKDTTTIPVTLADGAASTAAFRRLTIRELYTFTRLAAAEQTPELVALCCGKPVEWVDTHSDESYAALSARAVEENLPRAVTLAKSDPVTASILAPMLRRLAEAEALTRGFATPGPSSAPSSSAPPPSASDAPTSSST
jgi:hypothetical protein